MSAAITRAERLAVAHPEFPSVRATIQSYIKLQENYEREFLFETNALEMDVCSYRIMPDTNRATITGMTSVLNDFQALFTIVYDSIVNGPKKIAKVADDVVKATALGFGYTFAGSIGIMMTLDNKRGLFGQSESKLDEAMRGVFDIVSVKDTDGIKSAALTYGVAAIRAAHRWADDNAKAEFGADIVWMRKREMQGRVSLQKPEVNRLAKVIQDTTYSNEESVVGVLRMIDADAKTFRFTVGEKEITGVCEDMVPLGNPAVLRSYKAIIRETQGLVPESGVGSSYTLVNLASLHDEEEGSW